MLTRAILQSFSLDVLRGIARDYHLSPQADATKADLIEMILSAQSPQKEEASGFMGQEDEGASGFSGGGDDTEIIDTGNAQSGFMPSNPEGGSGFIEQEDAGSGFIQSNSNGGSGFVEQEDAQSGFLEQKLPDDAGSGFVQQEEEGSGFLGAEGEQTIHLSPLDPSGQVLPAEQPSGEKSRAHGLGPGDTLTLNGRPYTITQILSQSSGEAVIYLVNDSAGKQQVLKLYVAQQHASREPNGVALDRIRQITHPDILPLLDFGVGDQKYQGQYCFEVSQFAEGGDLFGQADFTELITPAFLRATVIPETFQGIKTLHKHQIFHCDIKPQNIFFLDKQRKDIVIGDYGSAKTFEAGSQKDAAQFSSVIGTNAYLPPEQARGFISPKNDFYSFGMVLLHLLYPQQIAREDDPRRVDMKKLRKINEHQFGRKAIIDYDPRHQELNQLIAGLTLHDDKDRWGEAEVAKWMKGIRVPVKYDTTAGIKPVRLGYANIHSPEDLLNVMEAHPTRWYGDLISDRHGYDSLLNWVANRLDIPSKQRFDAMIRHYKEDGSSFIKEAVARFFQPESPLKIGEQQYYFSDLSNLASEIRRYFKDLDEVWKINEVKKVRFSLFQFELALRLVAQHAPSEALTLIKRVLVSMANQLDTKVEDDLGLGAVLHRSLPVEEKHISHSHGFLLRLFYLFDKERGFRDKESHSYYSLEEVGHYFAQHHDAYVDPILKLERAFFLNRIKRQDLAPLGLSSFLGEVFADKAEVSIGLKDIRLSDDRSYSYQFTYQQSLGDYFAEQGFPPFKGEEDAETQVLEVPGRWFLLPPAAWADFRNRLEDERNVPVAAWEKPALQQSLKGIQRKAWIKWIGLGVKEWASAALWLLPWLGIASLFLLKGGAENQSLIQQWIGATEVERYAMKPEAEGDRVIGMYIFGLWAVASYLCMLIMRIWAGRRLEVIGKIRAGTKRWTSLQGLEGFGFWVVLAIFPLLIWASNWLWEVLGLVLIFGFGIIIMMMPLEKNGTGLRIWRTVAGIICLLAVVRLGLEVYSWIEFGPGWKMTFEGRGWLDVASLGLITLVFWAPPLFWQPISAHDKGRFLMKGIILLGLMALFFLPPSARQGYSIPDIPSISVGVPSSNRLIPSTYYATINTSAANVREAPNKQGAILGKIGKGVTFVVFKDDRLNYWWVVTEGDVQGYVYYELIELGEQIRTEDLQYRSFPLSRMPENP